jgi:antirestriction protein
MSFNSSKSIHIWTRNETEILTRAFLDKKSTNEIQGLLPNIKLSSIKLKLTNCSYLEKSSSNKTVSKMHHDVWRDLTSAFALPDVDETSIIEDTEYDAWDNKIQEEDGEEYFKCTGPCGKVNHYEDTDDLGMCGTCQMKSVQKKRK